MSPADRFRARFQRRIRHLSPDLGAEILKAWDELAAQMSVVQLAEIIALGDVEQVFAQVLNEETLNRIFAEVERKYFEQTVSNLGYWAKDFAGGGGITFGVLNPEVIESIQTLDFALMKDLKSDVFDVTREALEQGIRDGLNPRTVARGMRDAVGLTGEQLQWVDNFRSELENNSRAALRRSINRGFFKKPDGSMGYRAGHAGGAGVSGRDMDLLNRTLGVKGEKLTAKQIDRMVGAYKKRLTAWHAESVSRTATVDSLKNAQHLSTKQAIADGILDADRMWSEWVTTMDGRQREEHDAMNGDKTPFGQPFSNGETIPGESAWGCRCGKRDFLGESHGMASAPGALLTGRAA